MDEKKFLKYRDAMLDKLDDMSDEQRAELAGWIVDKCSVNRDTVEAFLGQLGDEDREEFAAQVEALTQDE